MRKGFVVSAVLYPLLVIALALIMGIIAMSDNRRKILDNMKLEVSEENDIDPEMSNTALYYEIASLKETIAEMQARLSEERLEELKSEAKEEAKSEAKLEAFPIGSIFTSTTNTNPGSYIGGTWEAYGSGRTLVGINTSDSDFNSVNKTGGSKNTTLSTSNLPIHSHSIPTLSGTAAYDGEHTHRIVYASYGVTIRETGKGTGSNVGWHITNYTKTQYPVPSDTFAFATTRGAGHSHNVTTVESTTGSQGSGTSFTNLPPYITVYFWKRIT